MVWVSALLLKLVLSTFIPLTTDEAYYWVWSWRPQLSYYDHPPFVAWLFWLGHFLEPLGNAVRWPAVILGHFTLLVWAFIWRELVQDPKEESRFSWWLGLALFSPLLGFGSIIVTPDLPVIFFWSLSLFFSIRVFKSHRTLDYLGLGASLGLGFCSKYHIVLFVLFLFAYILIEKKWREISWKNALFAVFVGLAFSAPVLIWNLQNDFISFKFQLKHGFSRPDYKFYWTWTYVLAQAIALFPTIVWSALRARLQGMKRILLYFAWGPLLFFLFSSFKALVEVNWPIVAYPAFFALAVFGAKNSRGFWIANTFWVVLITLVMTHVAVPWIPRAPEKLSEFSQFEPLLDQRSKYEPLYASTYQMASWVWYQTKTPFFKLHKMSRFDLFDTYPEGMPQNFPIYIAMKRYTDIPDWIKKDPQYKVREVDSLENDLVIVRVDK